jgi:hypothetical protein
MPDMILKYWLVYKKLVQTRKKLTFGLKRHIWCRLSPVVGGDETRANTVTVGDSDSDDSVEAQNPDAEVPVPGTIQVC